MSDKRAYFRMDVGYLSNPKIGMLLDDHPRAVILHLACIAYASQHATDGLVPMRLVMRQACAEQCDLDILLHCGVLEPLDGKNVMVHDYLEHQRSSSEVKTASDKGKRAALARWSTPPTNAPSNAPSMPDALLNPMPRKKERKSKDMVELDEQGSLFDEFWEVYPKKVAKTAAKRKWDTLVKKVDPDQIISGAKVYARSVRDSEARFIKQPDGWLNAGRWEDDLEDVKEYDELGFLL